MSEIGITVLAQATDAYFSERASVAVQLQYLANANHHARTTLFCERCPRRPVARVIETKFGAVLIGRAWDPVTHEGWRSRGDRSQMASSALILDGPFAGVGHWVGRVSCPVHGTLEVPDAAALLALGHRASLRSATR